MSKTEWIKLKCQHCGGGLTERNGLYECTACGGKWQRTVFSEYEDMLNACELSLRGQREKDISNLRTLLWKETQEENISNIKVEGYCRDIIKYLPDDFYANFYMATCSGNKYALGNFLANVNTEERLDDVRFLLDYILKGLKIEWAMPVGNFIERAYKDKDLKLYNKYRTWFDKENAKNDECVYQTDYPRDVFVAYSSKDMPAVEELVNILEESELTCFVAVRNLRHGSGAVESYKTAIHTAIEHCSVLVFVSSDNSRSIYCDAYKELSYIESNCKNMSRVEYLIKDYGRKPSERFFKKFFDGLEYCTTAQDVANRVCDIVMGEDTQNKQEELSVASAIPAADYSQRLKKLSILISNGMFDGIEEKLDRLESECEGADDSFLAEVYYYKLLGEYKARNHNELTDMLVEKEQDISQNKNYILAEGFVSKGTELELKLAVIKDMSKVGITQAREKAARKAEEERKAKEEADRKAKEEAEQNYKKGLLCGGRKEYEEAAKWYRKAAEQGHTDAQNSLGYCYYSGEGVEQDYVEAIKWFRKAAEQGNVYSQVILGSCYEFGRGVTQDYVEAAKWYRKAAEQGNASAQNCLGVCYEKGQGVAQDYVEAARWYRKAAEQEDGIAQYSLGYFYEHGRGVAQDYAEAVRWYSKVADKGNSGAQNKLGYFYEYGRGVAQDHAEAVKWYRKAAEQGNASAQYNLGVCYTKGQGVAKDYAEAIKWYRKAAQQGNKSAQEILNKLGENY